MAVSIPAQLSQALGGAKDPAAVVVAMFKKATRPLRDLHARVVQRSGIKEIKIEDADPKKAGKQAAIIKMEPSGDPAKLAAQYAAMITVKGKAGLYIDEAKRMAMKLPVGTAKSLDAEEAQPFDQESIALLSVGAQMREPSLHPKGLFGIDDMLILTVGVPILCTLIPIVLPMIIAWGAEAFTMITGGKDKAPAEQAPPESTEATIPEGEIGLTVGGEAYSVEPKMLLAAGAALLLLIWYLKRKG